MLKNKIFKILFIVFFYIWCLPQQLFGLIFRPFIKVEAKEKLNNTTIYYTNLKFGSITLGNRIYLSKKHWNDQYIVCHEFGHYKQNLYLGWLYFIVIGIPSIVWAAGFKGYRKKHGIDYYTFYSEAWANKLGGL